ncbi:hypothetical protein WJX73_007714 [Symbiochloris irregularis]|uniref:PDZ domain-containing protein n=1 Tax=Symbiochloris irregularis TaxID=706552 RepID=A0AAW1Q2S3_9CHLO
MALAAALRCPSPGVVAVAGRFPCIHHRSTNPPARRAWLYAYPSSGRGCSIANWAHGSARSSQRSCRHAIVARAAKPAVPAKQTAERQDKASLAAEWPRRLAGLLGAAIMAAGVLMSQPAPTLAQGRGRFSSTPVTQQMEVPDQRMPELQADEMQTVKLFIRNTPSVVNIANIASRSDFYMDMREVPQGMGSGFVWDKQGHIVTNFHVIRGASDIKVNLIDQSTYPAKFIGGDPDKDVAVLELQCPEEKKAELVPVTVGTSANLLVGQKVFALGNPFGLDHSMTQGIVSGVGRELTAGYRGVPIKNVIQTDAAINPGNSGGVLLDSQGRLIGINTAIADPSGKGSSSGVGFAIPVDAVRGLVQQILEFGKVVRPVLGISIAPPQTLRQLRQDGVLILEVPSGTPAAKAGLQGTFRDATGRLVLGDIIVGLDGRDIKLQRDLFEALDEKRPGDTVTVDLLRDGQRVGKQVTLGGRDIAGPND